LSVSIDSSVLYFRPLLQRTSSGFHPTVSPGRPFGYSAVVLDDWSLLQGACGLYQGRVSDRPFLENAPFGYSGVVLDDWPLLQCACALYRGRIPDRPFLENGPFDYSAIVLDDWPLLQCAALVVGNFPILYR
jgi:hypothetical protein